MKHPIPRTSFHEEELLQFSEVMKAASTLRAIIKYRPWNSQVWLTLASPLIMSWNWSLHEYAVQEILE